MENVKYIPGDLVMSKIHGIGVIQVCTLGGNQVIIYYLNNDITVGSSIDSVEPIPLTPEFLEKNGWIRSIDFSDNTKSFYHNDKRYPNLHSRKAGEKYIFSADLGEYDVISNIEFVHQLQHLLFGLGLDSDLKN